MSCEISIPVRPPFPWSRILEYLSVRSTPGLESVVLEPEVVPPVPETLAPGRYLRQTPHGVVCVAFDRESHSLHCSVEGTAPHHDLEARVRRLFAVDHDPAPVDRFLGKFPLLRPRIRKLPGVRPPGCWEPFELCLRVIIGQQVSVKGAHTLMGRLVSRCPQLDPAQLAVADLSAIGMPGKRVQTLRTLAEKVAAREVRFDHDWPTVAAELARVPGFGPWTLGYLGIRLGRDPDSFPEQDLGLIRAAGVKTPRELLKLAEPWRPYRACAAMYLWMVS